MPLNDRRPPLERAKDFQAFTRHELREHDRQLVGPLLRKIVMLERRLTVLNARCQAEHQRAEMWRNRCLQRDAA